LRGRAKPGGEHEPVLVVPESQVHEHDINTGMFRKMASRFLCAGGQQNLVVGTQDHADVLLCVFVVLHREHQGLAVARR